MPKAYWIGHVTVNNAEKYPDYVAAAQPAYEKYGAKFVIRGGRYQSMEGDNRDRHVVIEFKDYDTAMTCYNSAEYQLARAIRQANADSEMVIVEGVAE